MQQRCKALCIGKAPNWDCLQVLQQPHALLQNLVFQMSSWKTNDHAGREQSPYQLELDEALSLLEDHVHCGLILSGTSVFAGVRATFSLQRSPSLGLLQALWGPDFAASTNASLDFMASGRLTH